MRQDLPLPSFDRGRLTEVVRRALGDEAIEVGAWSAARIHGGAGEGGAGVFRLTGDAQGSRGTRAWSLVLKLLRAPGADADFVSKPPEGWDREVQTYRSGLLDDLPAGLAAPRCYAIDEPAGYVRLWLEDVAEAAPARWPIEQFVRAARHLGRFNGRYLVERPIPPYPWLQRNLLRWRAAINVDLWADFERGSAAHPLRRWWPGDLADRAHVLWRERDGFLDLLDRLPQVLVHGDADRRNLLARQGPSGDEIVAIDWAFTGVAALGEELVNLIVASALWFQADAADLPDLADQCLEGYVAGLREVGWGGDGRLARLGFAVAAALRYGAFAAVIVLPGFLDELAQASGQPVESFVGNLAQVMRFAFDQLDEARPIGNVV